VKPSRLHALLLIALLVAIGSLGLPAARAAQVVQATPTPTPTLSPTSPETNARNKIIGLVYLTAFGVGGYYLARWLRRGRPPRPPGPFGRLGR
jgi:hypothetical protein